MKDNFFLDTNVFIYAIDRSNLRKHKISVDLIADALNSNHYHISFQIVQEFINVALKKLKGFTVLDCEEFLEEAMFPFLSVYPSKELYRTALNVHHRWKFSFYDSLVIAAAQSIKTTILYSEDLQAGQSIGSLKIVNPFAEI